MTEQDRTTPVPGPPREAAAAPPAEPEGRAVGGDGQPFADLDQRPVAEHVAVFDAEHARLQQQLSSIDQL